MATFVTSALIDAIAQSVDVKLSTEAARALAPDVEYKLRELIQDSQKFARHAHRLKLTTEDVNNALRMRNTEPLYGFTSKDPARYVRAVGFSDVYCLEDPEVPVAEMIERPLPRAPREVGVRPHWLLINGVQPLTAENTPLEKPGAKRPRAALASAAAAAGPIVKADQPATGTQQGDASKAVQIQMPVQHALSSELQTYFTRAMKIVHDAVNAAKRPPAAAAAAHAAEGGGSEGAGAQPPAAAPAPQRWGEMSAGPSGQAAQMQLQLAVAATAADSSAGLEQAAVTSQGQGSKDAKLEAVLESIATDPGLHPLVPYLIKYTADELLASAPYTPALLLLLRLVRALLRNTDLRLDDYLHQLLPALLTCVVASGVGSVSASWPGAPDHWTVREKAAEIVAEVCARFGNVALSVQPRVTRTLLKALLDTSKPLTTHYGAVVGLSALGPTAVRLLLLPQLPAYLDRLQPLLDDTADTDMSRPDAMETDEAESVAGTGEDSAALQRAMRMARRADAQRVRGAMVDAAGLALTHLMQDSMASVGEPQSRTSAAALAKVAEAFKPSQDASIPNSNGATSTASASDAQSERARACAVLTMAWRDDVSLQDLLWATQEILGPDLLARLPQSRPALEFL